jgi:Tol biopolymer transport system component
MNRFLLACAIFVIIAGSASETAAQPEPGAPEVLIDSTGAFFMNLVWSPSGERLVVTGPGYGGIWLLNRNGDGLRQITDAPSAGFGMMWSPGGEALLTRVARYEDRRRRDAVAVFDVAEGERELLTDYRSQMPALPQWSPSGQRVVLPGVGDAPEVLQTERTAAPSSQSDVLYASGSSIRAAQPETGSARTVASRESGRVLNVTPSPDGSKIAYEVMGGPLVVMDADGANRVEIGRGGDPSWSPDGEWVAFVRTEDDGHRITASELHAARADGSARAQLTDTPDRLEMRPAWSPGGDTIAFDDHEGTVWLLPVSD